MAGVFTFRFSVFLLYRMRDGWIQGRFRYHKKSPSTFTPACFTFLFYTHGHSNSIGDYSLRILYLSFQLRLSQRWMPSVILRSLARSAKGHQTMCQFTRLPSRLFFFFFSASCGITQWAIVLSWRLRFYARAARQNENEHGEGKRRGSTNETLLQMASKRAARAGKRKGRDKRALGAINGIGGERGERGSLFIAVWLTGTPEDVSQWASSSSSLLRCSPYCWPMNAAAPINQPTGIGCLKHNGQWATRSSQLRQCHPESFFVLRALLMYFDMFGAEIHGCFVGN